MLRSLRRKIGAAGLVVSSLLPNARNVSFMGTRAERVAVAVEETVAREAAAVRTAATSSGVGVRTVSLVGGGVAAGGLAAERECGWVAGKAAFSGGKTAAQGIEELAGSAAARQGMSAAEREALAALQQGERRVVTRSLGMAAQATRESTAARAIEKGGFHIVSGGSDAGLWVNPDAIFLRRESIRVAADVINTIPRTSLQSESAVAEAFEAAFSKNRMVHFGLNRSTGVVRVSFANEMGVTMTAEFNAYSVARAAAAAGALAPAVNRDSNGIGS